MREFDNIAMSTPASSIQQPASRVYDTLIIGAGMSGLAAGIRLAYYDQRVCVLERHTTIGGSTASTASAAATTTSDSTP